MKTDGRYYTCLRCAHAITAIEQRSLLAAVDCPSCRRPGTFGPGVFVPDFEGYTMQEVARQRARKTDTKTGATP